MQNDIISDNPLYLQAQQALANEQYLTAGQLYEQLAKASTVPEKGRYNLSAIEAYRQARQFDLANRLIQQLAETPSDLTHAQALSLSSLLLEQGKVEQSQRLLEQLTNLSQSHQIKKHLQAADAFFQAGNLIESAKERITLDLLISDQHERLANQRRIINTLTLLTPASLSILKNTSDATLQGWVTLAENFIEQGQIDLADPNLLEWQTSNPQHPAQSSFLSALNQQGTIEQAHATKKVAVFLPLSGKLQDAANNVSKGIVAAAYRRSSRGLPLVRFYDTTQKPIAQLYQQAQSEGVDVIIGPLQKDKLEELKGVVDLSTPIIGLNNFDSLNTQGDVYSFSLSPEEDATQALSLAWLHGHEKALILTPQSSYGERLAQHFSNQWQQLGGSVAGVQSYPLKQADYSAPIKTLLNINESTNRFKQLRQRLNLSLNFEERRRHDADFVFLIASPRAGRLIKPQLKFHHAAELPVYSLSKINEGTINKVANRDLDDVFFCDMPSLITAEGSSLQSALTHWPKVSGAPLRLIAFGFDAYQVAQQLDRIKNDPFTNLRGNTGILSVTSDLQIKRQLHCGRFKRGTVKSLGLAPNFSHLQRQTHSQTEQNADISRSQALQ